MRVLFFSTIVPVLLCFVLGTRTEATLTAGIPSVRRGGERLGRVSARCRDSDVERPTADGVCCECKLGQQRRGKKREVETSSLHTCPRPPPALSLPADKLGLFRHLFLSRGIAAWLNARNVGQKSSRVIVRRGLTRTHSPQRFSRELSSTRIHAEN